MRGEEQRAQNKILFHKLFFDAGQQLMMCVPKKGHTIDFNECCDLTKKCIYCAVYHPQITDQ